MNKPDLFYAIIELIVLLIPIGGLVWKAAKQAGTIDTMNEKIAKLEAKVDENHKQQEKDVAEIKRNQEKDIAEIKSSINSLDKKIDVNNERVLTSLAFITEQIKEIKEKRYE